MKLATPAQKSRAFKALQSIWYAKAAATGFVDAEFGREDGLLKVDARSNRVGIDDAATAAKGGIDALTYASTTEYYSQACEYLWARPWDTFREREAWRLHCEGASLNDIVGSVGELLAPGKSDSWKKKRVRSLVGRLQADQKAWRAAGCPKLKAPVRQLTLWA